MGFAREATGGCTACFRITIILCGCAAVAMSVLTVISCEYMEFKNFETTRPIFGDLETSGNLGVYRFLPVGIDDCIDYPDNFEFDSTFRIARITSVIAVFAGLVGIIFAIVEAMCFALTMCCTLATATFFVAAFIAQACSFALFSTEEICKSAECSLGQGGTYSVAAVSIYFVTSLLVCFSPVGDPCLAKWSKNRSAKREAIEPDEEAPKLDTTDQSIEEEEEKEGDEEEEDLQKANEQLDEMEEPDEDLVEDDGEPRDEGVEIEDLGIELD